LLAIVVWVFLVFMAGSADRVYVFLGLSYSHQIWAYRIAVVVLPIVTFFVTRRVCRELLAGEVVREIQKAAKEKAAVT